METKAGNAKRLEGRTMNSRDSLNPVNAAPVLGKKAWMAPEIRDQAIKSLTEAKTNQTNETDPGFGPS